MFKIGQIVEGGPILKRIKGKGTRKWEHTIPNCGYANGLLIGFRTYVDGFCSYDSDGIHFIPNKRFEVALIVVNPRHNPVPVLSSSLVDATNFNRSPGRYLIKFVP